MLATSAQSLGTQHCRSRLPDKWPPTDLVTGIPRRWFPAWFLCIQVPVCTYWSSNDHPLMPGYPMTPASLPLPKASNLVLTSELGPGEGHGCLRRRTGCRCEHQGKKEGVLEGDSGLRPHLTHTPWLSHSIRIWSERSSAGLFVPFVLLAQTPSLLFHPAWIPK